MYLLQLVKLVERFSPHCLSNLTKIELSLVDTELTLVDMLLFIVQPLIFVFQSYNNVEARE